ncbi:hypothetical protein N0V90_007080 [Kalmusia sp. IMI 367209]|nr:hypothetical protein N0V90_007080 [Kalmusia sp. IMI 367209]
MWVSSFLHFLPKGLEASVVEANSKENVLQSISSVGSAAGAVVTGVVIPPAPEETGEPKPPVGDALSEGKMPEGISAVGVLDGEPNPGRPEPPVGKLPKPSSVLDGEPNPGRSAPPVGRLPKGSPPVAVGEPSPGRSAPPVGIAVPSGGKIPDGKPGVAVGNAAPSEGEPIPGKLASPVGAAPKREEKREKCMMDMDKTGNMFAQQKNDEGKE